MLRGIVAPLLVVVFVCGCNKPDQSAADKMSELHSDDSPVATGMAQEPEVDVVTKSVVYGSIDEMDLAGYIAEPASAASNTLPAVIMIHEWWGLNDNIKTTARRLAGQGYRVLAVDLYNGRVGETREQAREYMSDALSTPANMATNLVSAHAYLSENENAPRVGVIGWCFGGAQSLNASLQLPDQIDATVIYYGSLSSDREELAKLQMPIQGFFGAEDGGIPVASVREFEDTLTDLGKNVSVTVYEGAGHAFANPSGQNYVEDAANDSWSKTITFFDEYLKQ